MKGVPFSNKRYTKRVPFLKKMVYKRVRSWTSGRNNPNTPPHPPLLGINLHWLRWRGICSLTTYCGRTFHENARLPSSVACTTWRLLEPRRIRSFNFYRSALWELCLGKSARIKGHALVNFLKHCARKTSMEEVKLLSTFSLTPELSCQSFDLHRWLASMPSKLLINIVWWSEFFLLYCKLYSWKYVKVSVVASQWFPWFWHDPNNINQMKFNSQTTACKQKQRCGRRRASQNDSC